jgi:hypothetical protein
MKRGKWDEKRTFLLTNKYDIFFLGITEFFNKEIEM